MMTCANEISDKVNFGHAIENNHANINSTEEKSIFEMSTFNNWIFDSMRTDCYSDVKEYIEGYNKKQLSIVYKFYYWQDVWPK